MFSNVIDIKFILLLGLLNSIIAVIVVLTELALIDLDVLGDLPKFLKLLGLLVVVLQYYVALVISEVTQTNQHDVSRVNPHTIFHAATNGAHALDTIHAKCLNTSVSKHAQNLTVLLAILLEDEFTFVILSKVLRLLSVLTSLSYKLFGQGTLICLPLPLGILISNYLIINNSCQSFYILQRANEQPPVSEGANLSPIYTIIQKNEEQLRPVAAPVRRPIGLFTLHLLQRD